MAVLIRVLTGFGNDDGTYYGPFISEEKAAEALVANGWTKREKTPIRPENVWISVIEYYDEKVDVFAIIEPLHLNSELPMKS